MGILRVSQLNKAFGIEELFHDVSFEIAGGDKIGFIGANGTGKSTLMRCLMGLEEADSGQVVLASTDTIGYVEQEAELESWTLWEELSKAFEDVLAWQEEMKEIEERIAKEKDEAALASLMKEYAHVVDKFEQIGRAHV